MSTQDQLIRQSCNAIATQIFLVAPNQQGYRSTVATPASNAVGVAASPDAPPTNVDGKKPLTTSSSSSGSSNENRTEELRQLSHGTVRDAMTLYRLCHRRSGDGIAIVASPSSSAGGGGGGRSGGGGVVEEAAYCVCATVMSREPLLWASLVRRAQLLRPRKPSLSFAPPVIVSPVVVKEVARFYRRSRHLVPGGSASGGTTNAGASLVPSLTANPAAAASTGRGGGGSASTDKSDTTHAGVLSAQQAEAVAAAFFFKTMSAAERQRRPEVFEIWTSTEGTGGAPPAQGSSAPSTTATKPVDASTPSTDRKAVTSPLPFSSMLSALGSKGVVDRVRGGPSAQQRPRPTRSLFTSAGVSSSSLLFMDDWSGWRSGKDDDLHGQGAKNGAVAAQQDELRDVVRGIGGGAWGPRSSSSSSSDGDSSSGTNGDNATSSENRAPHGADHTSAGGGDGGGGRRRRRHKQVKATVATDAAVLERLYRLATTADAVDITNDEDERKTGKFNEAEREKLGDPFHSGASAATSFSSLFTSGKGMGLVALAAMTTQVQDALHEGRLTTLVRFPLLFRGLPTSALSTPSTGAESGAAATAKATMATVTLSATSEALTAASMARMRNSLGSSYASTLLPLPPLGQGTLADSSSSPFAVSAADSHTFLNDVVATYGSPGSFFCPSRLRPSSLLPRPPSLVTDTFLWTRLLICSTWLKVYADALVDDHTGSPSAAPSSEEDDDDRFGQSAVPSNSAAAERKARPYVRPSPHVQETIAYCVAVVKEARAVSAGLSSENDGDASPSPSTRAGPVCCPVCDRLVKEQQPVLWWSTLREDRAQLREQVRSLLENGSATAAEARVAAVVAADGIREGRGGRLYAAPQLSGAAAAGERVAVLQERWGMYAMGLVHRRTGRTSTSDVKSVMDRRDIGSSSHAGSHANEDAERAALEHRAGEEEKENGVDSEEVRTLWAALSQRVAATADLCTFMSAHPLHDEYSSTTTGRTVLQHRRAAPAQTSSSSASLSKHTRRYRRTAGRKRQRRNSTAGSDASDEESESSNSGSDNERCQINDTEQRSSVVDDANGTTAASDERARSRVAAMHGHRCTSHDEADEKDERSFPLPRPHRRHSWEREPRSSDDEAAVPTSPLPNAVGGFRGSRHAHEVAEEWERLLRRCGWVNAAPPRGQTQLPSSVQGSQRGSLTLPPSSIPSATPLDAEVYARWAASLIVPTAIPTPQQAAVLRRRLSRYHLEDVVRILVLGRGGMWSQYAALLFGADARERERTSSPTQKQATGSRTTQRETVRDAEACAQTTKTAAVPADDATTPSPSAPPRRATSMSLLNDDGETPNETEATRGVGDLAEQDSLLLVREQTAEEDENKKNEEEASPQKMHASTSPPALTSSASFIAFSPPPPLLPLHPPAKSSLLTSSTEGLASTPTRRSVLPSIPLHVSPLTRHTQTTTTAAAAAVDHAASSPAIDLGSSKQTVDAASLHTNDEGAESDDGAVPRSQLRAQQAAIHALLHFHPCFPSLREEDAVLECGSCFSLFHQDCIAPVQRDLLGQVFLCHTCRLKWARPYVAQDASGGLMHQAQEFPS